jgi:hypothetical protein
MRDSVSQSSVLPVPEDPTSSTLLLAIAPCSLLQRGDLAVVRIDRDGEDLLGFILADHVLIEIPDDGLGVVSLASKLFYPGCE